MPPHKTHFHFFATHEKANAKKNERVFYPTLHSLSSRLFALNLIFTIMLMQIRNIS